MPRSIPPPPAKGTRHPGAGRKPGQPNKISVEVRLLVSQMVNDPRYQQKLRADFIRRKVHPTIESLIWQFHLGKPKQAIEMSGALALDVTGRLEEERRIFASLDLHDLEQLAAESQGLVDRAAALVRARSAAANLPAIDGGIAIAGASTPQDVVVGPIAEDDGAELLGNTSESDK